MIKFKRLISRIDKMTDITYIVLKYSLLLSCLLLTLSLIILILGGGLSVRRYELYLCAKELFSQPAAILIVAVIGSACLEELTAGK